MRETEEPLLPQLLKYLAIMSACEEASQYEKAARH